MDLKMRKVALITGSRRGSGLDAARGICLEGCRLVLSARLPEGLAGAAAELRATGVEVAAQAADVGKPKDAAAGPNDSHRPHSRPPRRIGTDQAVGSICGWL